MCWSTSSVIVKVLVGTQTHSTASVTKHLIVYPNNDEQIDENKKVGKYLWMLFGVVGGHKIVDPFF